MKKLGWKLDRIEVAQAPGTAADRRRACCCWSRCGSPGAAGSVYSAHSRRRDRRTRRRAPEVAGAAAAVLAALLDDGRRACAARRAGHRAAARRRRRAPSALVARGRARHRGGRNSTRRTSPRPTPTPPPSATASSALLERASQDGKAALAVIKDGGGPRLGVAVPVVERREVLRLVYVRQPLAPLLTVGQGARAVGRLPRPAPGQLQRGRARRRRGPEARAEDGAVPIAGHAACAWSRWRRRSTPGMFGAEAAWANSASRLLLLRAGRRPGAGAPSAARPARSRGGGRRKRGRPTLAETAERRQAAHPEPARPRAPRSRPRCAGIALDRSIFRAYDIRGVVGKTLDANIARLIGQAIGSADARAEPARDRGRPRRPPVVAAAWPAALIEGLRKAGRDVIDIGEVPTPMAYFASFHLRTGCCVSVTGSHNPPDYNGFKIVIDGETLAGDAIQNLYARIAENRLHRADGLGLLSSRDIKARLHPAHRRRHPDRAQAQGRDRLRQRRRRRDRAASCWRRSAPTSSRCTATSTAPSRTTIRIPSDPANLHGPDQRRAARRRRHRPGASTATATASAWSPRPARSSIPTAC